MNFEILQILLNVVLVFAALYLIFIAAFTFGLYNLKEIFTSFNNKNKVKVSVLIAARNEENNIEKLLKTLYQLATESPDIVFYQSPYDWAEEYARDKDFYLNKSIS